MNILSQILAWLFNVLKMRSPKYPDKLRNKTKADFIESIKKHNKSI